MREKKIIYQVYYVIAIQNIKEPGTFTQKISLKMKCRCFWVSNETVLLVMETDEALIE